MRVFYHIFFTVFFLLLFLCIVIYVVAAVVSLFKETDEASIPRFIAFLAFIALCGWVLWEGYSFIISVGP